MRKDLCSSVACAGAGAHPRSAAPRLCRFSTNGLLFIAPSRADPAPPRAAAPQGEMDRLASTLAASQVGGGALSQNQPYSSKSVPTNLFKK